MQQWGAAAVVILVAATGVGADAYHPRACFALLRTPRFASIVVSRRHPVCSSRTAATGWWATRAAMGRRHGSRAACAMSVAAGEPQWESDDVSVKAGAGLTKSDGGEDGQATGARTGVQVGAGEGGDIQMGERTRLKDELTAALHGLDRGFKADRQQRKTVEAILEQLRSLSPIAQPALRLLERDSTWRLIYSDAPDIVGGGNEGLLLPRTGAVGQNFNAQERTVTNIVQRVPAPPFSSAVPDDFLVQRVLSSLI